MIKWTKQPDADPGFWDSADGRFSIWPRFNHSEKPSSYRVRDNVTEYEATHYTVRDAKAWAVRRAARKISVPTVL
jgi:hypothetical protein